MPTAVVEEIRLAYLDALRTIDPLAGYENSADTEAPTQATGTRPRDRRILLVRGDSRRAEEGPLLHDAYFQTFLIKFWTLDEDDDGVSPDARHASLEADIIKCVEANYTADGRVQNIFWQPSNPSEEGDIPARLLAFDALYYTLAEDPYSQ
jgi:hypothetical protein